MYEKQIIYVLSFKTLKKKKKKEKTVQEPKLLLVPYDSQNVLKTNTSIWTKKAGGYRYRP